jgi:hypothetical protein
LLATFDETVASGTRALASVTDEAVMQPWRLKIMGRVRVEKPRAEAFKDFTGASFLRADRRRSTLSP